MIKTLVKSIREYKKASILAPLFVTFEVILECILPLIISNLIDNMIKGTTSKLIEYSVLLLIMALLALLAGYLSGKFTAIASAGFAKNVRHDLYYKIQDFSFSNIDKFSSSSLVTRMTTDVNNLQMAFGMIIRTAVRVPLMLTFSIIMSFSISKKLSLIFVGLIPVLAIILGLIMSKAMPTFNRIFVKYDKLNESVQENINGIRVVKTFVREDYEKNKFKKASNEVCNDFSKAESIVAWNMPAVQLCMYISSILVSVLGANLIIKTFKGFSETGEYLWGELSTGNISSLITYGIQILISLMMLSMVIVIISLSLASAKRIIEVLKEESTLKNPVNPIYDVQNGQIDFNNVSFKYVENAEKYALENIDLHIKSGETVGIIGGTGSSKSTLVNLISRLYDTSIGEVYVGGVNVKDYDIKVLRNSVSVVLQKNVLFSGTIKDNLRWGNKEATDEELVEACRMAQANEFIESFPLKYDTIIDQGGTNVSGGQKQRLCIARALLKKPKILILDDSTSAVDTKTDALIRETFKKVIPETTKIIISQRVSSIKDVDKIVVMNDGVIVGIGSHDELIKSNDIYQEVYELQNKVGGTTNE